MKYLSVLFVLLVIDLCYGAPDEGFNAELVHLLYQICLKVLIGFMLFQRRSVKDGRRYEHDVHKKYKPFETFFYGETATKTGAHFRRMVRERTGNIPDQPMARAQTVLSAAK